MGMLGVTAVVRLPGPCSACQDVEDPITRTVLKTIVSDLGDATSTADAAEAALQESTKDELVKQTTLVRTIT
jgi:hypothetical protein